MKKVYCLDCDRVIQFPTDAEVGDEITCQNCEAEFEITKLNPAEIEWLYDDYDADDYDDDDDDDY
jgi:DNA-directed RNA polymerase subunit RPC12/RpoP